VGLVSVALNIASR